VSTRTLDQSYLAHSRRFEDLPALAHSQRGVHEDSGGTGSRTLTHVGHLLDGLGADEKEPNAQQERMKRCSALGGTRTPTRKGFMSRCLKALMRG
jgi:hypothetical protein